MKRLAPVHQEEDVRLGPGLPPGPTRYGPDSTSAWKEGWGGRRETQNQGEGSRFGSSAEDLSPLSPTQEGQGP